MHDVVLNRHVGVAQCIQVSDVSWNIVIVDGEVDKSCLDVDSISVINGAMCIMEVLDELDCSDVTERSVGIFEADVINLVDDVPYILFDAASAAR